MQRLHMALFHNAFGKILVLVCNFLFSLILILLRRVAIGQYVFLLAIAVLTHFLVDKSIPPTLAKSIAKTCKKTSKQRYLWENDFCHADQFYGKSASFDYFKILFRQSWPYFLLPTCSSLVASVFLESTFSTMCSAHFLGIASFIAYAKSVSLKYMIVNCIVYHAGSAMYCVYGWFLCATYCFFGYLPVLVLPSAS